MENKEKAIANDYLRSIVMNLPETPGIYQYLDSEGTIIYVGKAKNLKRRVYSYFAKEHESRKTRVLVTRIADIRYIVVNTEEDALLLENNLIKKYRPRYNVLLKMTKAIRQSASAMNTFRESSRHGSLSAMAPLTSDHTATCLR